MQTYGPGAGAGSPPMSDLDHILLRPHVTLSDIFREVDVTHLLSNAHQKLVHFFTEDKILKDLLHCVIDQPHAAGAEYQTKTRHATLACEIICLDIDVLLDKIARERQFLDVLWTFLDNRPPLNSLVASCFCKVMSMLLHRKTRPVYTYLRAMGAVDRLIEHLETAAVMELYIEIVTVVVGLKLKLEINTWLAEENLVEKLVDRVHPAHDDIAQYSAGQLLCELIGIGRYHIPPFIHKGHPQIIFDCPILTRLEQPRTIERLLLNIFAHMDHPNATASLVNGVPIILCMIDVKRRSMRLPGQVTNPLYVQRMQRIRATVLRALSPRFQDMYYAMLRFTPRYSMETTTGVLEPPLGKVRLTICKLVAQVIATNSMLIVEPISKTGVLDVLMDLFASYEWHNILHTYVRQSVCGILQFRVHPEEVENSEREGCCVSPDSLIRHLFIDCQILQRCLSLWRLNEIAERSGKLRKGYMGHLTEVINEIQKCRQRGPNVKMVQSMFHVLPYNVKKEWTQLIISDLDKVNTRNACPPMEFSLSPSEASSDASGDDAGNSLYYDKIPQQFENKETNNFDSFQ